MDNALTEATEATTPSAEERLTALAARHELTDQRRESLARAIALGAGDSVLEVLAEATRLSRSAAIVLPPIRLERLSRGRGWCRRGWGDSAEWGVRVESGYRVTPGRWIVYGTDGFSRRDESTWIVRHVQVGSETWTVAS